MVSFVKPSYAADVPAGDDALSDTATSLRASAVHGNFEEAAGVTAFDSEASAACAADVALLGAATSAYRCVGLANVSYGAALNPLFGTDVGLRLALWATFGRPRGRT